MGVIENNHILIELKSYINLGGRSKISTFYPAYVKECKRMRDIEFLSASFCFLCAPTR